MRQLLDTPWHILRADGETPDVDHFSLERSRAETRDTLSGGDCLSTSELFYLELTEPPFLLGVREDAES